MATIKKINDKFDAEAVLNGWLEELEKKDPELAAGLSRSMKMGEIVNGMLDGGGMYKVDIDDVAESLGKKDPDRKTKQTPANKNGKKRKRRGLAPRRDI